MVASLPPHGLQTERLRLVQRRAGRLPEGADRLVLVLPGEGRGSPGLGRVLACPAFFPGQLGPWRGRGGTVGRGWGGSSSPSSPPSPALLTVLVSLSLPAEVPVDSPHRGAAQFLPVQAVQLAVDVAVAAAAELSDVKPGVRQAVEYLGARAGPAGARPEHFKNIKYFRNINIKIFPTWS